MEGSPPASNFPTSSQELPVGLPGDIDMGASPAAEALSKKCCRCSTGQHLPKARSNSVPAFRRHELEHVVRFLCFSKGTKIEEDSPSGKRCVVCRIPNPDLAHFAEHRLEKCLANEEPLAFTRQDIFKRHLKEDHEISQRDAETLVITRKHQLSKTAFSCGFCVGALFSTKTQQLHHIEQHIKDGQNMNDWDENKMMRSLLRHPEVNPAWNRILAENFGISQELLSWPKAAWQSLCLELDLNSGTPENFASLAFSLAAIDYTNVHEDDTRIPLQLVNQSMTSSSGSPHIVSPDLPAAYPITRSVMTPITRPLVRSERATAYAPPPRYDSLSYIHTSTFDHTQHEPSGTVRPSQVWTSESLDPTLYAMDSPTFRVTEWQDGLGIFPAPASGTVKRKVSANKAKINDAERHPFDSWD